MSNLNHDAVLDRAILRLKNAVNSSMLSKQTIKRRILKEIFEEDSLLPYKSKNIGHKLSDLSASDKLILRMRDDQDKEWPAIKIAWEQMMDMSITRDIVRKRYAGIKKNLSRVGDVDIPLMLSCVDRIRQVVQEEDREMKDADFERAARNMRSIGTREYPASVVKTHYNLLMG